jgi:hypothetical protein
VVSQKAAVLGLGGTIVAMAGGRFVVSAEVEQLLGPRGVRQLDTVETFTCRCGKRDRTDSGPVSVSIELDAAGGPPLMRVIFAHARCTASEVIPRPGLKQELAASVAAKHGASSAAYFHIRQQVPRAVLIWSPYAQAMTVPGAGRRSRDTWIESLLRVGFHPLRSSIEEAEPAAIPGWTLRITASGLWLATAQGASAYEQDYDPGLEPWATAATVDEACLALTGTGLADTLARADWSGIEQALSEEQLIGAVVHVERDGH